MLIKYKLRDHDDIGDLYTLEDWINDCMSGGFIDYDGFGYLANDTQQSNIKIYPSYVIAYDKFNKKYFELPFVVYPGLTHIKWYNR